MVSMIKSYTELIRIPEFLDRFEYLKIGGYVGEATFGSKRYLNQTLYQSAEWRKVRDKVIIRDDGCDLAHPDYSIGGKVYIHHINPITQDDIEKRRSWVLDPENLICVSHRTHEAIHFGDAELLKRSQLIERRPGDTILW